MIVTRDVLALLVCVGSDPVIQHVTALQDQNRKAYRATGYVEVSTQDAHDIHDHVLAGLIAMGVEHGALLVSMTDEVLSATDLGRAVVAQLSA